MPPVHVSATVEVQAPAEAAWAVVADYDRDAQWRKGVRGMDPQPPGPVTPGTVTDERITVLGRTLRNGGEVTGVDPGHSFRWRTTSGVDAEGSREVVAIDESRCSIRLTLRVTPPRVLRAAAPLVRLVLQQGLNADAARLGQLIEESAGA